MRRGIAFVVALGVVAGLRVASPPAGDEVSLVNIDQGVTAWTFEGTRVFLKRDGAILITAFLASAPDTGNRLAWCPISEVFLDPLAPAMWTPDGRFITGNAERDLTTVETSVDELFILTVDPSKTTIADGKNPATVEGTVKARFDAWRAGQLRLEVDFCREPLI